MAAGHWTPAHMRFPLPRLPSRLQRAPRRRASGGPIAVLVLLVMLVAPTGAQAQSADEFNSAALDTAKWSFVDPRGSSSVTMDGGAAVISLPAGVGHDVWTGTNTAPRQPRYSADTEAMRYVRPSVIW